MQKSNLTSHWTENFEAFGLVGQQYSGLVGQQYSGLYQKGLLDVPT